MKKQRSPRVTYGQITETIRQTGSSILQNAKRSPTEKAQKVKDSVAQFGKLSRAQDFQIENSIRRQSGRFDIVKYFKLK